MQKAMPMHFEQKMGLDNAIYIYMYIKNTSSLGMISESIDFNGVCFVGFFLI